jgi:hypothetical protein
MISNRRARTTAGLALLMGLLAGSSAARAEAVIAGRVEPTPECAKAPLEAWLSVGTTLLYQVEIPRHGTFEFHVNSGKYNLVVVGASGCLAEAEVEARANDTREVVLKPAPAVKPAEKHALLDWLLPSAQAGWGDYCPTCNQGWFVAPPVSFMPTQAPWWLGYGAMTYPNFGYPGPWFNGGISGSMFPYTGGVFGAKPVLYVHGPEGTRVSIRARLPEGTHWLVAIPRLEDSSWSGTLHSEGGTLHSEGGTLHSEGGQGRETRLRSGDADYRYVFYDYRSDESLFQDTRGFCLKRGELIPRLSEALKGAGFAASEVEDFASYWTYKIPQSERYCVYPQTSEELRRVARLEIEPKPASLTQVLFIVQVGENLDGKGKFRRAPVATWRPEEARREPAAQARGGIEVREWGIGFLESRAREARP